MSVSNAWTNSTPASTARNNKVTVISDTGDNLDLLDIALHRIIFCTEDGGEFLKDHTYTANADEDAWIDITAVSAHTHSDADDGGDLLDIYVANNDKFNLNLLKPTDWVKAQWVQTVTGTGSIEDAEDASGVNYIRLRPNGTSGSSATINYPVDVNAYWAHPVHLVFVTQIETASSLALHIGVNADNITAADSNNRKMQAEVCTATNNNWWLRTANGSANTATDTGTAISTSKVGIALLNRGYLGTPDCLMVISSTQVAQKTSNIATSSTNTDGNILKFSIKNSTGADRPLRAYSGRLDFQTESTWGYG